MKQKEHTLSQGSLIQKRRSAALERQGYLSLVLRVIVLGLAAWILLTWVFLVMQASGNDMFPAVKDGDLVLGFRLQQEYAKDDVIIYTAEGKTCIGRIVAKESDVVTLDESGTLLVNGTAQSGEILYPTYAGEKYEYPLRVPEDSVYVLGDYRTQAKDSREYGPVSMEDVKGKVITILRRRGL